MLLILANIGVWLYVQGMGFDLATLGESVCRYGAIPAAITGRTEAAGVDLGPGLPMCYFGAVPQVGLFTSMFLHGSWLHLIANMWFLWLFGKRRKNNFRNNMDVRVGVAARRTRLVVCGAVR